jgi:lysophospholipase L1-like esterase
MKPHNLSTALEIALLASVVFVPATGCDRSSGTGTGTSGGAPGAGGSGGASTGDADVVTKTDGPSATGGVMGTGGSTSGGGTMSSGGTASGGTTSSGGASSGGTTGTGGRTGSGGSTSSGGATGSGGKSGIDSGTTADGGEAPDGNIGDTRSPDGAGRDTGGVGTGGASTGGTGTGGVGGAGGANTDAGAMTNITVWLAGDSTVANGSTPCPVGWGKQLQAQFNSKVKVTNSAQGGRSVQTWLYDVSTTMGGDGECVLNSTTYLTAWTTMLSGMKTGDYLFIQFGINDGDSTCNRHVGTKLFKTYYGMMAQAAKDRGANPIFVTPVSSISCSGSTARPSRGTYSTATKEAGTTYDVPVIDLEQLSATLYTSLGFCPLPGPDNSTTFASGAIGDFFCEDHTHFEAGGATQIAGLVAKALKAQSIGLASYLQ